MVGRPIVFTIRSLPYAWRICTAGGLAFVRIISLRCVSSVGGNENIVSDRLWDVDGVTVALRASRFSVSRFAELLPDFFRQLLQVRLANTKLTGQTFYQSL
jgi:hypothetical protein